MLRRPQLGSRGKWCPKAAAKSFLCNMIQAHILKVFLAAKVKSWFFLLASWGTLTIQVKLEAFNCSWTQVINYAKIRPQIKSDKLPLGSDDWSILVQVTNYERSQYFRKYSVSEKGKLFRESSRNTNWSSWGSGLYITPSLPLMKYYILLPYGTQLVYIQKTMS